MATRPPTRPPPVAVVIVAVVAAITGAVLLGLYAHGTFPSLSQDDADTQCADCVKARCPFDTASLADAAKACVIMKAAQTCTCSGDCARLCRQSNAYVPSQCTEDYCVDNMED